MSETLFYIIFTLLICVAPVYILFLSKQVRGTRELHKLNIILEELTKTMDYEKAKADLNSVKWKYHTDKVKTIGELIKVHIQLSELEKEYYENRTKDTISD